jgi:hypothetical protein
MKTWSLPGLLIFAIALVTLLLIPYGFEEQQVPETQIPSATISVNPSSQSISPGDQVTVEVLMDPGGNQISGLFFRLQFENSQITSPQVYLASVFDSQIDFRSPTFDSNYVEVALSRSPGTNFYAGGSILVATITFTSSSSASDSTVLSFDPSNTQIFDRLTADVLNSTFPGTITFSDSFIYLPVVLKGS